MKPFIIVLGQKYSSYNVSIMVGIIFALCLFLKFEKNISSAEKDNIISIMGLNIVFGFLSAAVGDKIMHFDLWSDFKEHLFHFTGMTFLCGFIGGFFFFLIVYGAMCRSAGKIYAALNAVVPYFILAQIFGRLGCLLGGCCFGKPTDGIYGIQYPKGSYAFSIYGNRKLYPTPVMEMCLLFMILLCAVLLFKKAKFICYILMYSMGRFFIEFFRGDNRGNVYQGLSPSQRICMAAFLAVAISAGIFKLCKKRE